MSTPLTNQICLKDRMKLVEKRTVAASSEPFRLFVRRTGVFIRSFETEVMRDAFIASTPDSTFAVKKKKTV